MEIQSGSIDFSQPLSGSGPRSGQKTLVFPRPVMRAVAGMAGYLAEFSGGNDHHIGKLQVQLGTSILDNTVTVTGTYGLRDWSGNWDDQYDGTVNFVVLADLQDPAALPPRDDLFIEDAELNQAVQFFRSDTYLDAAHQMPDNSIWLIADKDTGVRVYVDYDATASGPAGLSTITRLTGSLTVDTGTTTLHLTPTNPGGFIAPRRNDQINMAVIDHTLNFMIPGAWCDETVTMTCLVWDLDAPGRTSAMFQKTLTFRAVEPLNVFLVGVSNNPPGGANLGAPSPAAMSTTLIKMQKMYPIGTLNQTGFGTLAFNETVTSTQPVTSGCGSGMNDLLDALDDMRGGSDDIYLGTLPAGLVGTPGNTVGGCAPVGGYSAATFVDWAPDPTDDSDPAHEIGHCLGRQHAPCTGGRCNPAPSGIDPNYPQYGNFFSDSIGVFGFDPTDNVNGVKDPAAITDFMGYSPDDTWISAYTYNSLRGSNFGPVGGSSPSGNHAHGRQGVFSDMLHIGLSIARDRKVTRRPSFHFLSPGRNRCGCGDFQAELRDEKQNPLMCVPLNPCCDGGCCECYPKILRDVIPWADGARWLTIYEHGKPIYEEPIPDPPMVKIEGADQLQDGVLLKWDAVSENGDKQLWFVVQWLDAKAGEWRGAAARLTDRQLKLPAALFRRDRALAVRVLATSGIATGMAQNEVTFEGWKDAPPKLWLRQAPNAGQKPVVVTGVIEAVVTDGMDAQLDDSRAAWHGADGSSLAIGRKLDIRALPVGRHMVRFAMPLPDGGYAAGAWWVERTAGQTLVQQAIPEPPAKPRAPTCDCYDHEGH